jgi:hypothetical protein
MSAVRAGENYLVTGLLAHYGAPLNEREVTFTLAGKTQEISLDPNGQLEIERTVPRAQLDLNLTVEVLSASLSSQDRSGRIFVEYTDTGIFEPDPSAPGDLVLTVLQ